MLAAPDDAWWPQAHHTRACTLLPPDLIELQPHQTHAFCTHPARCETAAATCERWIRAAVAQHAQRGGGAAAGPGPPGTPVAAPSVEMRAAGGGGVGSR